MVPHTTSRTTASRARRFTIGKSTCAAIGSDGRFEVTACLADRKTFDFTPPGGTRTVAALSPIHDLGVTLVFDADMVVRAVSTFLRSHPYAQCRAAATRCRRSSD